MELLNRTVTKIAAISTFVAIAMPTGAWAQELEEIVVTARKRDESVFEIPISVQAFSQDDLDALGVNSLEALSAYTPGFTFQSVGQGGRGGRQNPNIRFRGVGVQNANPASRAGAVFWEGTYVSDGAGILPLMDLQRVEVIKGPQTAFFGRNTFAGAVNYIPQLPGNELNGKVSLSYSGSDAHSYSAQAAIGGPITESIGLRAAVMSERVGADYQFGNGDPAGEDETAAATFVATWAPTDEFFLKASGFLVESEDTRQLASQVGPVPAGSCNRTYSGSYRSLVTGQITGSFTTDLSQSTRALFCGTIPDWDVVQPNTSPVGSLTDSSQLLLFSNPLSHVQTLPSEVGSRNFYIKAPDGMGTTYRLWRYTLSADYDLPNEHTLQAAFARGESVSRTIFDNQFGTLTPAFPSFLNGPWLTGGANWTRDTYAEVRVSSGTEGRLRYMIGASTYEQDSDLIQYGSFGPAVPLTFENGENVGIFGSLDYDINDQLTLSLEGRWNDDDQTIVYDGNAGVDPGATENLGRGYSAFMPRGILAYRPTENINLYGSYSQSFLQGDFTNAQDYATANPGAGLNPSTVGVFTPRQELQAFEVGIKHRANAWLSYSVAAYLMDWDNQVFFELAPTTFTPLYQPGDSEYVGLDMEFQVSPTEWFMLSGGAAYVDAEFTDFSGTGSVASAVLEPNLAMRAGDAISVIGNRPRYIAEWTGTFSAILEIGELMNTDRNVWARLDGAYQGEFFIDNFEYNTVDGYWKFNIRAGIDVTDSLSVELYGNNITDDQSYTTAGGTTSIIGSPDRKTFAPLPRRREVGLKFVAEF